MRSLTLIVAAICVGAVLLAGRMMAVAQTPSGAYVAAFVGVAAAGGLCGSLVALCRQVFR